MRVSLCMIVRNEEADLPHCLESVVDLVQEIIVVDTGSTDATREVARRYGAKVVDYPWTDSFAAARNESLRHATGDWIFWMDADDRLDADNRERLRRLFASLPEANVAYLMKCVSSRDPHDDRPGLEVDHARLFRNLPGLRWEYRVHEQIMPSLARLGAQAKPCDVVIRHAGYEDAQHSWHKLERNLRLLLLEHAERPDDPVTLFNLGWTCLALGRPQEAASYLRRSLERTPENLNYRPKLYALLARAHLQTQQPAEALRLYEEGRRAYPDDPELLFREGVLRRELRDFARAEACFRRLLEVPAAAYAFGLLQGIGSYLPRHNLAVIYREQGRLADAETYWRAVVQERPDFTEGWVGLADLAVARQDWRALDSFLPRVEADPRRAIEAAILRARRCLAQRDFAGARALLQPIVRQNPRATGARLVLCHVLVEEGTDLATAERLLLEIQAVEPHNPHVPHNLAVVRQLRQRQARP